MSNPPPQSPLEIVAKKLAETSAKLAGAKTVGQVADLVREAARELIGADGIVFILRDDDTACKIVGDDALGVHTDGERLQTDSTIAGWCVANQEKVTVLDVAADERSAAAHYEPTPVTSLLMVPIRRSSAGAIGAFWADQHEASSEEEAILQSLADTAAVALKNIEASEILENLVAQRTAALRAVNEELESFAYTIAHDLKNPLSVIKTNSWTLREMFADQLPDGALRCVQRMDETADRMHHQIESMLSMCRAAKDDLAPEEVDLSTISTQILAELCETDRSRSVDCSVAKGLRAFADANMMRVVLENLLGNAWKYSSRVDRPEIEVGVTQSASGGEAFFVRDNGAGFDMEHAKNMFNLFKRLHTKDEFPGTGVGLTSVQRIINKHGGRVWAEAEVGKGATFFFTLPAVPVLVELEETLKGLVAAE